ncbi:MAG: sulfatase, partial [Thermoanaerobaculia bacterium]|nr:sulfatase [Thermoanaerobaculia bacterium]
MAPWPRSLAALAGVVLLVALAACGRPAGVAPAAGERPPNLVIVSFDSLRADHLGTYGYGRDTSPNLDRFAARSIVFERAYSTSSWTLPSHASLLSSLYPEEHGARKTETALSPEVVLLPEQLAAAGYRSAGVVSVGLLHRTFGFAQGWEIYDDVTAVPRGQDPERRRTSAVVGRRAAELLDELAPGPFLLFVHDYDVHFDYQPPPPYDTMFEPAEAPGFDPSNFAFNETIHR